MPGKTEVSETAIYIHYTDTDTDKTERNLMFSRTTGVWAAWRNGGQETVLPADNNRGNSAARGGDQGA